MLVLTRRLNEQIIIGDDIVITVTKIEEGRIKLGIDAPYSVPVMRSEIRERIQKEGNEKE